MKKDLERYRIVIIVMVVIITLLLLVLGFSYFMSEKSKMDYETNRMHRVDIFGDSIKIGKSHIIIVDFKDINPQKVEYIDDDTVPQRGKPAGRQPISTIVGKYRLYYQIYNSSEKSIDAFFEPKSVDCTVPYTEKYIKNKVFSSPFTYYIKVQNIDEKWAIENGYLLKSGDFCIG